jgi:hypothetical protein
MHIQRCRAAGMFAQPRRLTISRITMLNRRQYVAIQLAGSAIGLGLVLAVAFLVDHFIDAGWLKWILGILAVGLGQTASQFFAGPYSSYRKYAAANGGPDLPPSRFWATTGQVVVFALVIVLLLGITVAANRAPDGHWLRTVAALSWMALPGSFLFYLLIARDWRRELTSRRMLSNERCN